MVAVASPLHFFLVLLAGWVNREQNTAIDYLKEENGVLRALLEGRRIRLTDDERRRLAVKGRALGRKTLDELAGIVTPDTILRWYRKLVAAKYDGSKRRRRGGKRRTRADVVKLVLKMAEPNPAGATRGSAGR